MDAVELYVRDILRGGQRAESTITDAQHCLGHFARWRTEAGKGAPETLTRADMREFKAWLLAKKEEGGAGFHRNTARKVWVRVGALYRYLAVEEDSDGNTLIERNPMLGIELPKLKQSVPRVYTVDDLRKMMAACQSNLDRVILYSFIFTAMREGEVKAMAWHSAPPDEDSVRSYVDLDANAIVITSAKQDKSRAVPLHPLLRVELEAVTGDPSVWAEALDTNDYVRNHADGEWLFPDKQVVVRVMRRLLKASSTPGYEHQFRRTMLTYMEEHGVTDSVRHAIAGHAAKGVEQKHYLAVKDERKVAAIRSLYAGELPGCEATQNGNGNGGIDLHGLSDEQLALLKQFVASLTGAA